MKLTSIERRESTMYHHILVPVDGSSTSNQGLEVAIRLGQATGARLHLLHVIDEGMYASGFESYSLYTQSLLPYLKEGGEAILMEASQRVEKAGLLVDQTLVEGLAHWVADAVLDQVPLLHIDLIVIGTHGRRGIGRLVMGSDAEQVLRTSPVPVLLVRASTTRSSDTAAVPESREQVVELAATGANAELTGDAHTR